MIAQFRANSQDDYASGETYRDIRKAHRSAMSIQFREREADYREVDLLSSLEINL